MLQLYSNIKKQRCFLEMTQTQLAHEMGYADKSMIAKIEKGQVDIPLSKIIAFAKVLKISPSELMGWDESTQDEKSQICDLFHQCYGKEAYQTVSHFLQLDAPDRQTVDIMIDSMLKNDKYRQDTVKRA